MTMFFMKFLIVSLAIFSACTRTSRADSCETHINNLEKCSAVISFSGNCQSMTVNLSQTEYSNCSANQFFWSYPLNNLTLIIETPMTDKHQAYTIALNNEQLAGAITNVYRIVDGKETEITTHEKILRLHSDENYQVIVKFQGPTRLSRYGANVDYNSV